MHSLSTLLLLLLCAWPSTAASVNELRQLLSNVQEDRNVPDARTGGVVCNCGSGYCTAAEDPYGLGYYCHGCAKQAGGRHCQIPDPCGEQSGDNPCRDPNKPRCKVNSFMGDGFICVTLKRTALDDLLDRMEKDVNQGKYLNIRTMIVKAKSVEEGLAGYIRSLLA